MKARSSSGRRAADFLVSVAFLGSLTLLLVNDFIIKRVAPGTLSGKVSDLTGPIVASLLIVAGVEVAARAGGRGRWAQPWWFALSAGTVVGLFALIKLTAAGARAYSWVTDTLIAGAGTIASPLGWHIGSRPSGVVADAADVLLATLTIPIVTWVGLRWRGKTPTSATC